MSKTFATDIVPLLIPQAAWGGNAASCSLLVRAVMRSKREHFNRILAFTLGAQG
jgi:hypothetical protein